MDLIRNTPGLFLLILEVRYLKAIAKVKCCGPSTPHRTKKLSVSPVGMTANGLGTTILVMLYFEQRRR
jgi:hypothetical protein